MNKIAETGKPSSEQLVEACQTLFEHDYLVCRELLNHLTPADLNVAFSHQLKSRIPENASVTSLSKTFIARKLKEVTISYKTVLTKFNDAIPSEDREISQRLLGSLTSKQDVRLPAPGKLSHIPLAPTQSTRSKGRFMGTLPRTKLRFAMFLYYKGLIDQQQLADALNWQKQRRPLIGQIAIAWDFLSPRDFAEVIFHGKDGIPFGQVARNRGKLSETHIAAMLSEQQRFGVPIGQYFTHRGILTGTELDSSLEEMKEHNARYPA